MRILGIDPGLATIGFACIEKHKNKLALIGVGCIQTPPSLSLEERLQEIYEDLKVLIQRYKPDHCCLEELFFKKNITNGIQVAHARGVISLALQEAKIPIHPMNPMQMKSALTGNGQADKKAVQKMICLEFGLSSPPKPDDAADAVGLALSLAYQLR